MDFLFEIRFNFFDLIVNGTTIILINNTNNYWFVLLLIPAMWLSVKMQDKLEIRKILKEKLKEY